MEDVAPKLLKAIEDDFEKGFNSSDTIKNLYDKVTNGKASYKEANDFAIEVGELLAKAYQKNLSSQVLPDRRMYYNIAKRIIEPTMKNNYSLITYVVKEVQQHMNDEAKIGIKPVIPEFKQDKIDGIINRISNETDFDEVKWIVDEPIVTYSQSIVDDAIKENAEFHFNSGMTPKIIRRVAGNCCEWCQQVAGTYLYPNIPRNVYRRHQRCRCTVEYHVGKFKQDVHSKRWYGQDSNRLSARKLMGMKDKELTEKEKEVRKKLLAKTSKRYEKQLKEERIKAYMEREKVSHRRAANRITRMKKRGEID